MANDARPVLSYGSTRVPSRWRGPTVTLGIGLVGGLVVGLGITGESVAGSIFAGLAVGVASALAARSHPLLLALAGGVVVVASCVSTITLSHWFSGHWAVGAVHGKMLFIALILLPFVCVPALVAAAFAKRRAA